MKSNIGLIGIGVMGENLALNMESKGFAVSVYDISKEKVQKFINGGEQRVKKLPELFRSEN